MLFAYGHKVVLIGDRITDCGRGDAFFPLGNGYVSMVAALAAARCPERGIEFVNRGIGGNTVRDLELRSTSRWRWRPQTAVSSCSPYIRGPSSCASTTGG